MNRSIRAGSSRAPRSAFAFLVLLAILSLGACSSSSGPAGPPGPDPDAGALRLMLDYGDAAQNTVQPNGFRQEEVSRVDVVIAGTGDTEQLSIPAGQTAAFVVLNPGTYSIAATAFGSTEVILFTADRQVGLAARDTVDVALQMLPALGDVTLNVAGQTTGTVDAVAGEDVPFTIIVRNTQGQFVPGSAVRVTTDDPAFSQALLEGGNTTDGAGAVHGVIRAPHSGTVHLDVKIDDRPVSAGSGIQVDFATAVNAGNSTLVSLEPAGIIQPANGQARYTFTVEIEDKEGNPLPGIPVAVTSNRNAGLDPLLDVIQPTAQYTDRVTDSNGRFEFTVKTTTSSFLQLDDEGRLFTPASSGARPFVPSTIQIVADGVLVEQRDVSFTSTINPAQGDLNATGQFIQADGQDSAVIIVQARRLQQFGGGPAGDAFVEITDTSNNQLNHELDITPEPGFNGFRTNGQGEWRGRIRSTTKGEVFVKARVDGRDLTVVPRSFIFQ